MLQINDPSSTLLMSSNGGLLIWNLNKDTSFVEDFPFDENSRYLCFRSEMED